MDAVLKHLGLRSDFIVCHPDVIDDPLFHAPQPPPTLLPHPRPLSQPLTAPSCVSPHAAFSAHLLGILNISNIYMDPGVCDWFSYHLISLLAAATGQ